MYTTCRRGGWGSRIEFVFDDYSMTMATDWSAAGQFPFLSLIAVCFCTTMCCRVFDKRLGWLKDWRLGWRMTANR